MPGVGAHALIEGRSLPPANGVLPLQAGYIGIQNKSNKILTYYSVLKL